MNHTKKQKSVRKIIYLFGSLFLMTLLLCDCKTTSEITPSKKPNIIFIMADDLGYGQLGCYGQKHIQTPYLDQMAAEGIRFTQAYSGHPVCAPSRSVLMTGLHSGHTTVRENRGGIPLRKEDVTVAQILKKAGYTTGLFGKWGLGDANTESLPNKKGFDQFFGYLHQIHAHYYYPDYLWKNDKKNSIPENQKGMRGKYSHDLIVEEAFKFLRKNKDKPFFLYLPFTIPHAELLVPEASLNKYKGKFEEKPFEGDKLYSSQPTPSAAYAAMTTLLDESVGQILALLKKLKIDENTIVFFTSDNGASSEGGVDIEFFESNGPLHGTKKGLYEGGIRVPLIVRWPGRIPKEKTTDTLWASWDFLPTVVDIAGMQSIENTDGLSLLPTLLDQPQKQQHPFLYWEQSIWRKNHAEDKKQKLSQAVRMGDWKAWRDAPESPLELYNLKEDIGEKNNIAAQYPKIISQIEIYLKTARAEPVPQIEPPHPSGQKYE